MSLVAPSRTSQNECAPPVYRFGTVEVRPAERALLIDGDRADLGGRAFDVLLALIKNRGRVMNKDELFASAWPGLVVEENNLQQQISMLRKLIGREAIQTVPGRGYRLTLAETSPAAQSYATPVSGAPVDNSPAKAATGNANALRWSVRHGMRIGAVCALLVISGAATWWVAKRPESIPVKGPLSIAVLPFANLTGDSSQVYLADGLTAALADDLTRIRAAHVVDASKSFAFKDKSVLAQQAGAELGVHFVLVGSVQRDRGKIRVHAQLDDTASGAQLWTDTFDGDESDLFAMQDQVTAAIVNSIDREMVVVAARESEKRRSDPKVADLLLRAWALNLTGDSEEKLLQMEDLYCQALAIEPDNAVAMVGLANVIELQTETLNSKLAPAIREQKSEESRALALKARSLDPGIPGIYVALGGYAKTHDDFARYRQAAEARLALEPKNPVSYLNLAETYLDAAEPQRAIELINHATDMDPKNRRYWPAADLAYAYFMLGDDDAAIRWSLKAQEKNSTFPYAYAIQAMAHARKGDERKSRAVAAELRRVAPTFTLTQMNQPTPSYPAASKEFWDKTLVLSWRLAGLPEAQQR